MRRQSSRPGDRRAGDIMSSPFPSLPPLFNSFRAFFFHRTGMRGIPLGPGFCGVWGSSARVGFRAGAATGASPWGWGCAVCSGETSKKRSEGGKMGVPLSFGTFAWCWCEILKAGASSWSPGGGQGGGFVQSTPNPAVLCAPKTGWEGGGRTASPRGAQPSSWQHGAAGHRSPSLPKSLSTSPPSSLSKKRIYSYDIFFKRNGFSLSGAD